MKTNLAPELLQMHDQPFLHELVTAVAAPATVLSTPDGQLRRDGAQGWLVADVRHLAELVVTVDGREPVALGHRQEGPAALRFVAAVRHLGDEITEPTVRVERLRHTAPDTLRETIALVNDSRREVTATVSVRLAADLAPVLAFRAGQPSPPVPPSATGVAKWVAGTRVTTATTDRAPDQVTLADDARLDWHLTVPSRSRVTWTVTLAAASASDDAVFTAPADRTVTTTLTSANADLTALFGTGTADLAHLLLADAAAEDDVFAAAGAPWYLTLFGRDSLWTARFALPFGTGLAMGTLRTLARRQGTKHDQETGEEPGKIAHEIRRVPSDVDLRFGLPPVYYGTIDATPLWISLTHDAWRWGADVSALLGPLRRALDWVLSHQGFLAYQDVLGRGLANQGWKDSPDSVQDRAGTIAEAPVALSEAQAYAHRAALDAAALLDAFGEPGADEARAWAARMNTRFRAAFWVRDEDGPFPALALDAQGAPVDTLASNMGHLLGSGLLTGEESALVAARLGGARLNSGFGLRTFDGTHPYFNPVGYHTGSVWPHDTAIAVDGLARAGHADVAAALATGVVRAGARFGHRLPELYGGWAEEDGPLLDYPSTCRPQAWSAASALVFVRAALGLTPDGGTLGVRPSPAFASWFPLTVDGIEVGGRRLRVTVDEAGAATVTG
ncbi:glycogen debranching N-terminal domain-containing protein [Actinophytocola glycyrrhizae]|uniref:Glycogen debranching N-terminal domain-containing protein n=1 Tax=Actinophytocola glycyrrhizae TaxID=2044873 RepID=A0ABV9RXG1_9PSEU